MTTLENQIVDTVAAVLAARPETVRRAGSLFDLDGFDSLSVVAILERLEDQLGVEVDPDAIVPEAFESVDTLTDLMGHAVHGTGAAPTPTEGLA
jgi:acyl carrier protein